MATRGRPSFKPTAAQRRKVSIAAGGGMSHEAIAIALGISRVTLDKYFAHELSVGAHERRLEVLQALHAAAKKGNVSAVKAFLAGAMEFTPQDPATPQPEAPSRVVTAAGKKEAANQAAKVAQAGTGWEGLLPTATPH